MTDEQRQETIAQLERISKYIASIGEKFDYTDFAIEALEQEPCEDAVSRRAVLDIDFKRIILTTAKPVEMIEQKVKALPPVNPQPKTGHWIRTGNYFSGAYSDLDYFECSCCGEESLEDGDYCPNCGAKMIEPQESEE